MPKTGNLTNSSSTKKNLFKPGISGNPSGRPKRTEEETQALEEIRKLAPTAVAKMAEMLRNKKTPSVVKVKICEIILDRTYGKAPASLNVSSDIAKIESSRAYILSLVQRFQESEESDALPASPAEEGSPAESASAPDSVTPPPALPPERPSITIPNAMNPEPAMIEKERDTE